MSKIIFFWILTLIVAGLSTTSSYAFASSSKSVLTVNDGGACNLPAPSGLIVTDVSSNSASVEWQAVAGAVEYYIEARDANTNALYFSNTTTALDETCTGLPANTDIEISVKASCGGGEISPNAAKINVKTDYVIDVIANGYSPCEGGKTPVGPAQGPTPSSLAFSVLPDEWYEGTVTGPEGEVLSQFNFTLLPGAFPQPTAVFYDNRNNNAAHLSEGCLGSVHIIDNMYVQFCEPKYAKMRVAADLTSANNFYLYVEEMEENVSCGLNMCKGGSKNEGKGADGRIDSNALSISETQVAPNPFTNVINIQFDERHEGETAEIMITHIDGRVIKSLKTQIKGHDLLSINTDDIQSGMYVLQIVTETEKTVKMLTKTK